MTQALTGSAGCLQAFGPAGRDWRRPGRVRLLDDGYNPANPVDQAIMATRKAVFPLHGLMP
jgi:hypothetical protein